MRVLLLHNRYQQAGGEDQVVANEHTLLTSHGHEVRLFTVTNDAIRGIWSKLITAWRTPYSFVSKQLMAREIAQFKPNLAHVHNFFPLLTPSIYDACVEARVAVVQTLHNYRTICPGALLMRDGKVCEDCLTRSAYTCVLHKCYRGSILGTLAVARMVEIHRRRGTWNNKVDRFIALTHFAKAKFIDGGFPEKKIAVKPNFVDVPDRPDKTIDRHGALYVGRLSKEKGVQTLIRAWKTMDIPVQIVGDGPMLDEVKMSGAPHLEVSGYIPYEKVEELMKKAAVLVFPSEWYEGFPMALGEAFAHGLPAVVSRLGAMAEIVEDGVTGLHFKPGDADDLAEKVMWIISHPEERRRMGENARREYEAKYTPERNYQILMDIYEQAIEERHRRRA